MITLYRIKVTTEQKNEGVTTARDGRLLVSVRTKRAEGRANERAIFLLSKFLNAEEKNISIVRGHTSSTKTIRVQIES